MDTLFSEEEIYRIHDISTREEGIRFGRQEGLQEGRIQGCIETSQELGQSRSDAKERVIVRFHLDEDTAEEKIREYWIEKE